MAIQGKRSQEVIERMADGGWEAVHKNSHKKPANPSKPGNRKSRGNARREAFNGARNRLKKTGHHNDAAAAISALLSQEKKGSK